MTDPASYNSSMSWTLNDAWFRLQPILQQIYDGSAVAQERRGKETAKTTLQDVSSALQGYIADSTSPAQKIVEELLSNEGFHQLNDFAHYMPLALSALWQFISENYTGSITKGIAGSGTDDRSSIGVEEGLREFCSRILELVDLTDPGVVGMCTGMAWRAQVSNILCMDSLRAFIPGAMARKDIFTRCTEILSVLSHKHSLDALLLYSGLPFGMVRHILRLGQSQLVRALIHIRELVVFIVDRDKMDYAQRGIKQWSCCGAPTPKPAYPRHLYGQSYCGGGQDSTQSAQSSNKTGTVETTYTGLPQRKKYGWFIFLFIIFFVMVVIGGCMASRKGGYSGYYANPISPSTSYTMSGLPLSPTSTMYSPSSFTSSFSPSATPSSLDFSSEPSMSSYM